MEDKYLQCLAGKYPTIGSVASEMVNLSAIRSLPKGTEYFFSDLHGEYEAFLYMLRSASGMIKKKIDAVLLKSVSKDGRDELANLIYYPERTMKELNAEKLITDEWRRLTIYRLILICQAVSAKYTRSRVRKRVPKDLVYILDELLNVTDDINKEFYYEEIIKTILDTRIADDFIVSSCKLIQSLAIDKLHIIGDIFDRGPRADIIMEELMSMHDVDIQWGNHDISWLGAALGNPVLVANVIRISMRYNNVDLLEDGYGINLRALAVFAGKVYADDPCSLFYPNTLDDNIYDPVDTHLVAKMHKAITIIQLKLEGQMIAAHEEWGMKERDVFGRVDFTHYIIEETGKSYKLKDTNFPTVDKKNPLMLSKEEKELLTILVNSFRHSEKLQKHMKFMLSHGSMYKVCNDNLMFHGCIPMEEDGTYARVNIQGESYSQKALLDKIDDLINTAYFGEEGKDKQYASDFMWYLWCGANSPLYGKNKMSFFERIFLEDTSLHQEYYNAYYRFCEEKSVCEDILEQFGIPGEKGHIINGHVPVKIKEGESPVKAQGKLFVIDGGISKAYQKTTGIAGYTLIYDSHCLSLAEHKPFVPGEKQQTPVVKIVEKMEKRVNIADIDKGQEILEEICELRKLLDAYRSGKIKEKE